MSSTIQIDQLPSATVVGAADLMPVQQAIDGVVRSANAAQVLSAAGGATVQSLTAEANARANGDAVNAAAAATAQASAIAAQETANAAQPAIAANAGKVLTGPASLGGAPGTLAVGGANGLIQADAAGNISAQTVIPAGSVSPIALAAVAANAAPVAQPVGATTLPIADSIGSHAFFANNDIIPRIHLTNLAGNSAPVIALMGDSTGLPGDANGNPNGVDASQVLWAALKSGLRRQNPGATFNFDVAYASGNPATGPDAGNFSIGSTSWQHAFYTGTYLSANGFNIPPQFTDLTLTWLQAVQATNPDVLFLNFGINYPDQGFYSTVPAAQNALYQIELILAQVATWAKVPNVIFITNATINRNVTSGLNNFAPSPIESYKGVAAAVRTFCRSAGALFNSAWSSVANLQQFGLIDIGRVYLARTWGIDVDNQYLKADASAVVSGIPITNAWQTIANTTDGDFALGFTIPSGGNLAVRNAGVTSMQLMLNGWNSQRLTLLFQSSGNITCQYAPTSNATYKASGTSIAAPAGDVTVLISARNEHLRVTINGIVSLDAQVPRFVNGGPIAFEANAAPSPALALNVTSFYSGRGTATSIAFTDDAYWGGLGNTQPVLTIGPVGGNGDNHPSSISTAAIHYQVINASNLAAPPPDSAAMSSAGSRLFLASGSGAIPPSANLFRVIGVGGGQGGAGGATITTSGSGGGGGGTGAKVDTGWLPVAQLPSLAYIATVGAGGMGGAAGASGGAGTNSTLVFGSQTFTFPGGSSTGPTAGSASASAGGRGGGTPYLTGGATAGNAGNATVFYGGIAATGGGCTSAGVPSGAAQNTTAGGPGVGAAGGGLLSGVAVAGASGGTAYGPGGFTAGGMGGAVAGGAGRDGTSQTVWPVYPDGSGGGGGGANAAGIGGAGGSGGQPGAGGGGGGSGTTGGGQGGAGGAGMIFVEWC